MGTDAPASPKIIQVDTRGRLSLKRHGVVPAKLYQFDTDEKGVITLTPVNVTAQ